MKHILQTYFNFNRTVKSNPSVIQTLWNKANGSQRKKSFIVYQDLFILSTNK